MYVFMMQDKTRKHRTQNILTQNTMSHIGFRIITTKRVCRVGFFPAGTQRWDNVETWHCSDVEAMLYQRYVDSF